MLHNDKILHLQRLYWYRTVSRQIHISDLHYCFAGGRHKTCPSACLDNLVTAPLSHAPLLNQGTWTGTQRCSPSCISFKCLQPSQRIPHLENSIKSGCYQYLCTVLYARKPQARCGHASSLPCAWYRYLGWPA